MSTTPRTPAATGTDRHEVTGVPLHVDDVSHRWGDVPALGPVSMEVAAGEFVALVGPSGCGKSTLLRLLAGLDRASEGAIAVGSSTPDEARRAGRIGWLAQRPALLPWLSVRDNVALARRLRDGHADAGPDPSALLARLGLAGFDDALPDQLSGGMHQRVGLARTLALDAPLWLMDEPLAALDELTRDTLAHDVAELWRVLRPTVVWVTHHVGEAVALADRVVVLSNRPGRIVADVAVPTPRPRDVTRPVHQDIVRTVRDRLASALDPVAAP